MDFKKIDWTALGKKLMDPKAAGDLNAFLEKIPQNVGQTVLIAAGIAWASAAAAGLFTTIKLQQLSELRMEMNEAEALVPIVPKISDTPIPEAEVKQFAETMKNAYKGLTIQANGSTIIITARSTSDFGQFREAVGHVQNGGSGWRVSLEKLCVGRECDKNSKLAVSLKINKVKGESPS